MLKRNSEYHEFLPSMIASMEKPPSFYARLISMLIISFAVISILWLCFSKVDIVVSAQGKVVPSGNVKIIQASEQGIVRKIFVIDGQLVKSGDPLIELDSTSSGADEQQLIIKHVKAQLTVQRLRAELGEDVSVGEGVSLAEDAIRTEKQLLVANNNLFDEQVRLLNNERDQAKSALEVSHVEVEKVTSKISHLARQLSRKRKQAKNGLIAGQEVDDTAFEYRIAEKEKAVLDEKIIEAQVRLKSASEKFEASATERRSELYKQLSEAEHLFKTAEQDLIKAQQRTLHQVLKSPINGIVQQLAVHTIGGVVTHAQNLMVVVPENAYLQVDAQVLNKDIGFVNTELPVNVKIDAFEYTRYGMLEGDLEWVGGDAIVDEEKGPIYPARIALLSKILPNKVNDRIAQVVPGMSATADIVIGQRRLIEYFIGPILRYKDESLTER